MEKPAAPPKPPRGHACVHAVSGGPRLAEQGIITEAHTRQADIDTTATVPRRSAALDVCVQQQPEETQRLTAGQGIVRWSATPIGHPNPTARSRHRVMPPRTANVSKSLPAQGKHEIQMPSSDVMTRAVLLSFHDQCDTSSVEKRKNLFQTGA